jgi:low temperature requirement protein LtrA
MRRLQMRTPLDRTHLSERFGLFVIIVLGEAVVGVVGGLAEQNLDASSVIGALFAMGIAFSIWWVYFDEPDDTAVQRMGFAGPVWIFSHLPLLMAIAATGVAIEHVLALDEVSSADRWLLCIALSATMAATAVIHLTSLTAGRDVLRHTSAWWRLAAAAMLLVLGVAGANLESPVLLTAAALICFSQVVLDVAFDFHEQQPVGVIEET